MNGQRGNGKVRKQENKSWVTVDADAWLITRLDRKEKRCLWLMTKERTNEFGQWASMNEIERGGNKHEHKHSDNAPKQKKFKTKQIKQNLLKYFALLKVLNLNKF